MATTLYRSPSCFLLLPSRKLLHFRSNVNTHVRSRRKSFRICACSAKKSRRKKSYVKSNEELCREFQEFMSAFGLPEGHFPTMKEFSAHGRTDLANIVRRRGYKVVRDLLSNSITIDINGWSIEQEVAGQQDEISSSAEGQDEKAGDIVEHSSSNDIHVVEDYSSDSRANPESSYDYAQISPEISIDESVHAEWKTNKVASMVKDFSSSTPSHDIEQHNEEIRDGLEGDSLSKSSDEVERDDREVLRTVKNESTGREVLIMVKFHGDLDLSSDVNSCLSEETSDSYLSEEKAQKVSQVQDEKANIMANNVPLDPGVSYMEYPAYDTNVVPGLNPGDNKNFKSMDLAVNTSLEDKVAKFIQNGDLDTIEDDVYGTLDERTEESERFKTPKTETEMLKSLSEENFEHELIRNDAASASDGISEQFRLPSSENYIVRKDVLAAENVSSSDIMKDVDDEISKRENQVNRLKFLLHQMELELHHLKDQIEKEKLSLSNLQLKTGTEIIKAQKFISEKEAELLAAEESLSGLVEVNIQYRGEGEFVEVAGSFNGWNHPIKMDPQPFSSNVGSTRSRKSRLWSTMLWLYPGVYEIKFIVDGQWTVDEEIESVIKGGICNNILRVGR